MMFLHISGEPHTNHVGKDIPARVQRNIACRCRCCLKFNDDENNCYLMYLMAWDTTKNKTSISGDVYERYQMRTFGGDQGMPTPGHSDTVSPTTSQLVNDIARRCAKHHFALYTASRNHD